MSTTSSTPVKYSTIGTHSGTFHCDEAASIYMLQLLDEFKSATIVRSRDMDELSKSDVLVDVGGEYDHDKLRYDHHQQSFVEVFSPEYSIRLSSAGLIYKHYGKRCITQLTGLTDLEQLEEVYQYVYRTFILALDAIDNGVPQYPATVKPLYRSSTDIGSRVARLNPSWNETNVSDDELMTRFIKAIEITGEEFKHAVTNAVSSWLPSRVITMNAIKNRFNPTEEDPEPSGQYLVLEQFAPWKDHFFTEQEKEIDEIAKGIVIDPQRSLNNVLYVVYPSGDQWRYLAVPIAPSSFEIRLAPPQAWRGLRGKELDAVTGIEGCTFIHHNGFTGGNATKSGLIAMLKKSIEASEKVE